MKRRIKFLVTVGSYFPEKRSHEPFVFPIGGEQELVNIEFETKNDKPSRDDFDIACKELRKTMRIKSYHIWYWWWKE